MAKYRARFNDKARQGSVNKRNVLKHKTQKNRELALNEATDEERAEEERKRQRLHEMARPEADARKRVRMAMQFPERANAAKKKRLEKYIERQVRKEEKDILLEKLAGKAIDSSQLISLGKLGTGSRINADRQKVLHGAAPDNDSEDQSSGSDVDDDEGKGTSVVDESSLAQTADQPVTTPSVTSGTGFGFANLPSIGKRKIKKVSWREKLGVPQEPEFSESESEEGSDEESEDESEEELGDGDGGDVSNGNVTTDLGTDERGPATSVEDSVSEEETRASDSASVASESSESEQESSESSASEASGVSRGKEFAQWAQTHEISQIEVEKPLNYVHAPRPTESEENVAASDAIKSHPGYFDRELLEPVVIKRTEEVDNVRINLPAVANEQQVMEYVHHFDVVIVTGATGSGKTTQIPQFLFEAGYCRKGMIGVTQPRRVAAVSMAKRIGYELNGAANVDYQIRFDTTVGKNTDIKLMTDGVLIREMSSDLLLNKYSCIIIDEAHERSVNTDILIGLLSRVVKYRRQQQTPLKLIIMSATLRVSDFAENMRLFSNKPPIVNIDARQFEVTNHFSRRTSPDYVEEAVKKAKRIHERLPDGGILIFLTGKEEIDRAVGELDPSQKQRRAQQVQFNAERSTLEEEFVELGDDFEEELPAASDEEEVDGESDIEEGVENMDEERLEKSLKVLPLYSLLSTEEQMRVFETVPKNTRLCVVATNVAETSLTIPNIRYVIDCGRAKQRVYDGANGIQKYLVKYTSKASADQRSGRAGRTGPGHCYRLFSAAVYERDFPEFMDPEILRMPVEGLVLQMKAMGVDKVAQFPFPTEIPNWSLTEGVKTLQYLNALDANEKITVMGQQMSLFPLHPRHAKMLLIGNQNDSLPFVIALVSSMTVANIFNVQGSERPKLPVLNAKADVLQLLAASAAYSWTQTNEFCASMDLRPKAMKEVESLRGQLCRMVAQTLRPDAYKVLQEKLSQPLPPPNPVQVSTLMQVVAAAYIDQVAVRLHLVKPTEETQKVSVRQVSRVPYESITGQHVYIHPSSIMNQAPDYVVYQSLTLNESETIRMRPLTTVTLPQLGQLAKGTPLVSFSKPLGGAYAPKMKGSVRESWVVPRFGACIGTGGAGWDLPPQKLKQHLVAGKWVNI